MNQRETLEKILDITRRMMATVDLDELLQVVIDNALELLDAERASLLLYDAERNELVSRIAVGERELRFPADRGIAGATIAARAPINVADAYTDPRFNQDVDRKTGFHTRNLLALPLFDVSGELVGVLELLNKKQGSFDADDVQLATTLAAQAGVCLQRARLLEHYQQKLEMERALEIARDIQRDLLPKQAPKVAGFDIAGISEPADRTGGDLFDFIPLENGCWLLVVADVTGHGIGPALVAAETRAMLRTAACLHHDPGRLLSMANRLLAKDLDDRFVTCFVGLLEPQRKLLTYASAGHGPIFFYRQEEGRFDQRPATGLPLGMFAAADYDENQTVTLASGDLVLIPTDGCFEMVDADGEAYGTERLLATVKRQRDGSSAQLLRALLDDVLAHLRTAPQQDDCTAVVVRVL